MPRTLKDYIAAGPREGGLDTRSEYIRSLIRDEQDPTAIPGLAALARRLVNDDAAEGNPRHPMQKKKDLTFGGLEHMDTTDSPALQIVLAEDNPADVMLVRMALRDAGLNCALRVLEDGEQAISFFETIDADPKVASVVDLLLLDMHLPKRDGEDILNRLRSTEHFAQTRVIVMTASDAPRDHDNAERHAAMHYFRKPATLAEFMRLGVIVRDLLSPKRPVDTEPASVQAHHGGAA